MPNNPSTTTPIVLVPGMAADASMFEPQASAVGGLVVADWIEPRARETLGEYAKRLAESVDASPDCLLGGASFGGIVALEMARHLRPRGVVLIGSVRSPDELPRWLRSLRWTAPLTRWAPIRLVQWLATPFEFDWLRRRNPLLATIARLFCEADPGMLHWSLRELFRWRDAPTVDCPVWRIHGEGDPMFPPSGHDIDHIIAGGGHVISLSHADDVNIFLRDCQAMATIASESK